MHRLIILFSIFILTISCQSNVNCKIDSLVIKSNDSIISKVESDSIGQKWWNDYMGKLKEPRMNDVENESYRLIIYNSLGESSKIYRIIKNWNSYKLVYKEFGKEEPESRNNELLINKETKLSRKNWTEFQKLLRENGFWSLPVTTDRNGLDGTSWVLEGQNPNANECTNREYHIVARWQPIDTMKVMKLNYKLIELNGK